MMGKRKVVKILLSVITVLIVGLFMTNTEALAAAKNDNILVVYFSVPETTRAGNMSEEEENSTVVVNGRVLGNTQYAAQIIQRNTGGNIFRIEPERPYTTNHDRLVAQASREQSRNARPAISRRIRNIDKYDTIFIGYPNWWGDMPMIMYTFLEGYDLSGKTIIPFITHGGSGFSDTISTIARLQPRAEVIRNGYSISRDNMNRAEAGIKRWLNRLGYSNSNNSTAARLRRITLNRTRRTMRVGSRFTLRVRKVPTRARGTFRWRSSNRSVATVSSRGVVRARRRGRVRITVTSRSNPRIRAVCRITVRGR